MVVADMGRQEGMDSRRVDTSDPGRESLRWWRGIARCEDLLDAAGRAIHVLDREGDNYDLFAELSAGCASRDQARSQ